MLPLAAQAAFAESASRVDGFTRLVADAGSGAAFVQLQGDDAAVATSAAVVMASARVLGGIARAERRAPSLRGRISARGDAEPGGLFLMRRVKEAFDPAGVLEPGRSFV